MSAAHTNTILDDVPVKRVLESYDPSKWAHTSNRRQIERQQDLVRKVTGAARLDHFASVGKGRK